MMPANTPERFWARVEKTDDCWLWTGAKVRGYGRVSYEGKPRPAHRVAYELSIGPIPEGLQLDHLCRVQHCVNPAHLEPVTGLENQRRARPYRQPVEPIKACKLAGHPYTEENTYVSPRGQRMCRACARVRSIARLPAKRAARIAAREAAAA